MYYRFYYLFQNNFLFSILVSLIKNDTNSHIFGQQMEIQTTVYFILTVGTGVRGALGFLPVL